MKSFIKTFFSCALKLCPKFVIKHSAGTPMCKENWLKLLVGLSTGISVVVGCCCVPAKIVAEHDGVVIGFWGLKHRDNNLFVYHKFITGYIMDSCDLISCKLEGQRQTKSELKLIELLQQWGIKSNSASDFRIPTNMTAMSLFSVKKHLKCL